MHTPRVFVGSNGCVAALNPDSGEVIWNIQLKEGFFRTGKDFVALLETPGRLYAHCFSTVFCVNAESGEILWSTPVKNMSGVAVLSFLGKNTGSAQGYLAGGYADSPGKNDIQP